MQQLDATAPTEERGGRVVRERVRGPVHGGWILMVVCGLLAGLANYTLLRGDGPTETVAVLRADAPPGTPLDDLAIEMVPIDAADDVLATLVTPATFDTLRGTVLGGRTTEGSLLRTSDLRAADDVVAQAMSIPIEPSRAVGGALQPGDLVDVIAGEDPAYLVRRAEVLDIGGGSTGGLTGGAAAHAITLAVDEEQALRIAAAMRDGQIDLVRVSGAGR